MKACVPTTQPDSLPYYPGSLRYVLYCSHIAARSVLPGLARFLSLCMSRPSGLRPSARLVSPCGSAAAGALRRLSLPRSTHPHYSFSSRSAPDLSLAARPSNPSIPVADRHHTFPAPSRLTERSPAVPVQSRQTGQATIRQSNSTQVRQVNSETTSSTQPVLSSNQKKEIIRL